MIRSTITATLVIVLTIPSIAQELYGNLELSIKNLKTLHRFLVGDTVVVFFRDGQAKDQGNAFSTEHWAFIHPGRQIQHFLMPELYGKEKVAVMRRGPNLFFYFAEEEKKQLLLKVLTLNVITNEKNIHVCTAIPDNLLVTALDRTLVFLYRGEGNELGVMEIDGDKVIHNSQYRLPFDVFKRKPDIAFIDDGALITPGQAFQPLKIYRSGARIVITYDDIDYNFKNKDSKTFWVTIETGSRKIRTSIIPEPGRTLFKSIWHDGLLYKIVKDRGFHIMVYEGEELLDSFSIPYRVSYASNPGMLRDDAGRRVFNNRNVRDVMDNLGKPFIVVQKLDSATTLMKLGTQKEVSNGYSPIIPATSFASLFASLAVSSISHALADESYVHHYFYVKGNLSTGFEYTDETGLLEQKIDQYELFDPATKIDYRYKSYLRGRSFTVAFYMREKSRKLEVWRFQ